MLGVSSETAVIGGAAGSGKSHIALLYPLNLLIFLSSSKPFRLNSQGGHQGASTSGYIANLVFWDVEPRIVKDLLGRGFQYSRFADDITISCSREPSSDELSGIVSTVTGM